MSNRFFRLFRLAAGQGYARAQYDLGNAYLNGRGVPQDDKEAARLYRLAAEQGNVYAQQRLDAMLKSQAAESTGDFQKGLDAYSPATNDAFPDANVIDG